MYKSSSNATNTLSEEDQLDLLKDSIELRFTQTESNEFVNLSKFDPSKLKIFSADHLSTSSLNAAHSTTVFSDKEGIELAQKSVRQLCGVTILVALFATFVHTPNPANSLNGLELLSTLSATIFGMLPVEPWSLLLAAFPLNLALYAAILTIWPSRYNHRHLPLKIGWHFVAWCGILHFFISTLMYGKSGAVIGFGYYIAMTAIFAYYYMAQWSGSFDSAPPQPDSSTAKL